MKVFVDSDYGEEVIYSFESLDTTNGYLRSYGRVYDVPKKLIRNYKRAHKVMARLSSEIEGIVSASEGERSPYYEEEQKRILAPKMSVYQLRHVKSGLLTIELTTPSGAEWDWYPEPGREPDGIFQWYAKHAGEESFSKHGEEFRFEARMEEKLDQMFAEADGIG